MQNNMKTCSNKDCTQVNPQPFENFYPQKTGRNGLTPNCATCLRARQKKYAKSAAQMTERELEMRNARAKRWYDKNRAACNARARAWKASNRLRVKLYNRAYKLINPEAIVNKHSRRRARKVGAQGTHTKTEFLAKVAAYNGRCHWCGKVIPEDKITKDHVIALSIGGTDDISNIVPACKSCNCSKQAKLPSEFMGRLL